MTIEEKRARAAKIMNYGSWATPDTNLQQCDELKAKLRELGLRHATSWNPTTKTFFALVGAAFEGESKLSEGDALLDAVSKIPEVNDENNHA